MATYTRPDVYIEEILTPDNAPQGVSTSIAAFVGATQRGPANKAILVSSFDDFKRIFGDALENESLFYSVRSFFQNGGSACYIVRLISSTAVTGGIAPANTTFQNQNSTPASFLKFAAGYRGLPSYGTYGSGLAIKATASSLFTSQAGGTGDILAAGSVGDTSVKVASIAGLAKGDMIRITDDAGTPAVSFHTIAGTRSELVAGQVKHFIDLESPLSAGITLGVDSAIFLMSYDLEVQDVRGDALESFSGLSVNPNSDRYIETVINDEETGSRFITVEDLIAAITPSEDRVLANGAVGNAIALSTDGEAELTNFSIADDLVGDEVDQTGLYALIAKDQVNLLCVPPSINSTGGILPKTDIPKVQAAMLEFCGKRLDLFAILDAPQGLSMSASAAGSIGEYRKNLLGVDSYWGALYYPHLNVPKTSGSRTLVKIPPSGAIAGLYSRVDALGAPNGGVASSPAGYGDLGLLRNVSSLEYDISEGLHGDLNVMGVNCIKVMERANGALPGSLVLGARTLSSTNDFRYINVRRMMTFIEKSVKRLGKPFLFRNNGPRLWAEMTNDITSFLRSEFQAGNLAGSSEAQAFFVKIDATTNTAENIQQGILVGEIGVALMRPAEFVVFRFSQIQSGSQE